MKLSKMDVVEAWPFQQLPGDKSWLQQVELGHLKQVLATDTEFTYTRKVANVPVLALQIFQCETR